MKDWAIAITAAALISCLCIWVSFSIIPIFQWWLR